MYDQPAAAGRQGHTMIVVMSVLHARCSMRMFFQDVRGEFPSSCEEEDFLIAFSTSRARLSHTSTVGGKQHEIVQDWRIPAKKGRSSTPLSTSPTSVSTHTQRTRRKYTNILVDNQRCFFFFLQNAIFKVEFIQMINLLLTDSSSRGNSIWTYANVDDSTSQHQCQFHTLESCF